MTRLDADSVRTALNRATPNARIDKAALWLAMAQAEPLLTGSALVDAAAHEIETARYMREIGATWKMQMALSRLTTLQEQVLAEISAAVRSEKARDSALAKGENPIHDEIERLGRIAAFDHEPHELVRTVRRLLPKSDRLSDKQIRRVLIEREIKQKRT